jgi:hypothetical protein
MFGAIKDRSSGRQPALTEILGSAVLLCAFASLREKSVFIDVHPWLKNLILQNEPNFPCKLLSINTIRILEISQSRLIKAIQTWSSPEGYFAEPARPNPSTQGKPICVYWHPIAPIYAFSRVKKDCLFL